MNSRESFPQIPYWRGWCPLLTLPLFVIVFVPPLAPRWAFMWTLALAIFAGCKWLTWRRTPVNAPWWKHVAYLLAWPGFDANGFLSSNALGQPIRPARRECIFAAIKLLVGCILIWIVVRRFSETRQILAGWIGMAGLILVLHFGSFHLLSCAWRGIGVNAKPLMNRPIMSCSLGEFWGRRWNTAFRDLTYRFLFRPLSDRLGPRRAILCGFVISGLIHELVISVPAGAGYGLPTVFFATQGLAIFAERSMTGSSLGLGRGWRGWLFTMLTVTVPAYGLFHPPFVRNIIMPFLQRIGAH